MTDPTADAAKLLPCPLCGPDGRPWCQTAADDGYEGGCLVCGLKLWALKEEDVIKRWNTRPPPAPPAGESVAMTCCSCGVSMREPSGACKYQGNHPAGTISCEALQRWLLERAVGWGQPLLKQAADLIGLAARLKVEDAEVAGLVAKLRNAVGWSKTRDGLCQQAAELLERLAGELAVATKMPLQYQRTVNDHRRRIVELMERAETAESALVEREVELAKAKGMIEGWKRHAARQQQKASAEKDTP